MFECHSECPLPGPFLIPHPPTPTASMPGVPVKLKHAEIRLGPNETVRFCDCERLVCEGLI